MNESTARNIRVQDRYDELMRIGKHGHYETMFQVVREETESLRQQLASVEARFEGVKQQRDTERISYLNEFEKNQVLIKQLTEANHAHEFMNQQYLDALKERNQLRKDVAKLQEALHCKLTWKPS